MAIKYVKTKVLTMLQQRSCMRVYFPDLHFSGTDRKGVWAGPLKHTKLSQAYEVKVEYLLGLWPEITILSPPLQKRDDQSRIPHVYEGDYPCLYYPKTGEWNPHKLIATYVIPWISMWLYFYEVWLATGNWYGEGIDHGEGAKSREVRSL